MFELAWRQVSSVDQLQHDDHQILMFDRRRRAVADQLHRTALELPRGGHREQLMKFRPFAGNPRFVAIKTRFRVASQVNDLTAHEFGQQLLPSSAVLVLERLLLIASEGRLERSVTT